MKNNYFMFKQLTTGDYLLTNELGYYCFVNADDFRKIIEEKYDEIPEKTVNMLKKRMFLYDVPEALFVNEALHRYRANKRYLFMGTCLHIFVLTNSCNMNCIYCQAQDFHHTEKGIMDFQTAERAVEIALQSPSYSIDFEFQGGEPLLNFPTLKHIIEYAEQNKNDKMIHYSVVTNTLAITDEMMDFFTRFHVSLSTSLDGDRKTHNNNRPKRNGEETYAAVINNILRMRQKGLSVGAIQTTTRISLGKVKEIVDAYVENGLDTIFLRPLTPLGYAKEHWDEIGYHAEEFLEFYQEALEYILDLNIAGKMIREGHAMIFLSKIIGHLSGNYMELRSPCGAGIGQLAYYYNGNIYTCDEARMLGEMGNDIFCIGNVKTDTYQSLMDSHCNKVTCQSSILETLPGCCDCAYHPFCGTCPVVNMASNGSLFVKEINDYRCRIYKGILDVIFEHIHKNGQGLRIFETWILGRQDNEKGFNISNN